MIDPYNDFLHPDGKVNAAVADTLKHYNTIKHLKVSIPPLHTSSFAFSYTPTPLQPLPLSPLFPPPTSLTSPIPPQTVLHRARAHHIPIYYGLHQQWAPGFYSGWSHMSHPHHAQQESHAFAAGEFGSQILEGLEPDVLGNDDVVVSKHWSSS